MTGIDPAGVQQRLSLYKQYKEASTKLLFWLVNTYNRLLDDLSSSPKDLADPLPPRKTSGEVSPAEIVSFSRFIAQHGEVPSAICSLLYKIIVLRSETADEFDKDLERHPKDAKLRKGNAAHRHFISILRTAYDALGGEARTEQEDSPANEKDLDDVIFSNFFQVLAVDVVSEDDDDDNHNDGVTPAVAAPQRRDQRKGNKSKKRTKRRVKQPPVSEESPPNAALSIPLESYRIIHDDEGLITDYFIAINDLMKEAAELRAAVQEMWWEVAYHGFNSAVAGAVSEVAVSMVRKKEVEIFIDFPSPGHDWYDTVVQTVTRGNIDGAEGSFSAMLEGLDCRSWVIAGIDVKEQLCWHSYQALVHFAEDYQQNRNGLPTKRMQKELGSWDPHFDLQSASKEERLAWRRVYTINWLYDLVNVFTSIPLQRNKKDEGHGLENVDWSPSGPWGKHRRLYGLNQFAGFVTSLAMQKPGTNIRNRIQPHHVFRLQCIVDSMTIFRGWTNSIFTGHILAAPASSRPSRHLDHFLDRAQERGAPGYLETAHLATARFAALRIPAVTLMDYNKEEFIDWLGQSKCWSMFSDVRPSRFSSTNRNGLWEYSPYLCGIGLAEALSIGSMLGLALWDSIPEIILLVHLHNMLLQRGFLRKPVALLSALQELYPHSCFEDGKPPKDDFLSSLLRHVKAESPRDLRARLCRHSSATPHRFDLITLCDASKNRFFTNNSLLVELFKVDWIFDRLPGELSAETMNVLTMIRAVTGTSKMAQERVRGFGIDAEEISFLRSYFDRGGHEGRVSELLSETAAAELFASGRRPSSKHSRPQQNDDLSARGVLRVTHFDLHNEVVGVSPRLALNHTAVALTMVNLFIHIQCELFKAGKANPNTHPPPGDSVGNIATAVAALRGQDEESLRVIARALAFEAEYHTFSAHAYWDKAIDVQTFTSRPKRTNPQLPPGFDESCVVM